MFPDTLFKNVNVDTERSAISVILTVIVDDVIPAGTTKSTDISAYGETLNISIIDYPKAF